MINYDLGLMTKQKIEEHKNFIESFLGVGVENTIIHRVFDGDKASDCIALGLHMRLSEQDSSFYWKQERKVKEDITEIVIPENSIPPDYGLSFDSKGRKIEGIRLTRLRRRSSVGFILEGIKVVFLYFTYVSGPGTQNNTAIDLLITSKEGSGKLRNYIKNLFPEDKTYTVITYDANNSGDIKVDSSTGEVKNWKDLILDQNAATLVRSDIETFLQRKEWFKKNNIPFRRGYLLHGPPGNGKTSLIKAILSSLRMNAYTLRLFSRNCTDEVLEAMFRDAQRSGPNLVVLEDIDRAFPKTGETRSNLGLHTLLNCMDGLESQEGLITVATANEPTILDRAILRRPGRFDRVVLFGNPNSENRTKFFLLKAPYLVEKDISAAVDATEGFSFAQLQETYIFAGQYAFDRGEESILGTDLHLCAAKLREITNSVTSSKDKTGFVKGE